MIDQVAKIRFKVGQVEVECEALPDFIREDLFGLLQKTLSICGEKEVLLGTKVQPAAKVHFESEDSEHVSTNTIASRFGAKSGPELAIAAAACLCLVRGKSTFTRKELLDEMQGAVTFYRASFGSNLTKTLRTLVSGQRFNLVSRDTFTLSASERQSLGTRLAQSG